MGSPDPYNPCVLARAGAWLDRAAFNPRLLPDDLTIGIALAVPVSAGLIIFKLRAVDGGTLADSWHQEPGTPVYGAPYGPYSYAPCVLVRRGGVPYCI